mgnify:CR=1 FL=1
MRALLKHKTKANNRLNVSCLCQIILQTLQKTHQIGHRWRLVPEDYFRGHEAPVPAFGNKVTLCVHNYLLNCILCH